MKRTDKILYLENAGAFYAEPEYGDLKSCRIRTAFSVKRGKRIYLEASRWTPSKEQLKEWNKQPDKVDTMKPGKAYAVISSLHYITDKIGADGWNVDDENRNRIPVDRLHLIEWNAEALLNFVNSLGAKFSTLETLPKLAGYYVHRSVKDIDRNGNTKNYNYGDEFIYDNARTEQAEKIKAYFDDYEKTVMGKRYPNNSVYFDNGVLKVTICYNCYNDCFEIPDVFAFDFNYQRPNSEVLRKAREQHGIYSNKEWLC